MSDEEKEMEETDVTDTSEQSAASTEESGGEEVDLWQQLNAEKSPQPKKQRFDLKKRLKRSKSSENATSKDESSENESADSTQAVGGVSTTDTSDVEAEDELDEELVAKKQTAKNKQQVSLNLSPLSGIIDENKKQPFYITLHIYEGCGFEGNNLNPICKVTAGKRTRETRIRKTTNNPYWNQSLHITLRKSMKELHEIRLLFTVLNVRRYRSNALIGQFNCDVAMVYSLANHCLENKWLVLTSSDENDSDICGYLKVWVCVLSQGDKAPIRPLSRPQIEDTEDNLLYSNAVRFRTVTLLFRIYTAYDLPTIKANSIKKWVRSMKMRRQTRKILPEDMVNPMLQVAMAGKDISTKVIYLSNSPSFYQELRLQLKWPTVGKNIVFRLYDCYKVGKNELISTLNLPINRICESGPDGFLPTFGPTYVTFYGAQSSETLEETRKINRGLMPSTAYQGRALLEIRTVENEGQSEGMIKEIYDMTSGMPLKTLSICRSTRYVLYCSYQAASKVADEFSQTQVQFEVSIGYYGDSRRTADRPSISTTESCRPVYDNYYDVIHHYFMPWTNRKPCCILSCEWEQPLFRFAAANYFRNAEVKLRDEIDRIRQLRGRSDLNNFASEVIFAFDQLIMTLAKPIPFPSYEDSEIRQITDLDVKLFVSRRRQSVEIMEKAQNIRDETITVDNAFEQMSEIADQLLSLSEDPQLSGVPDVFIWLISNRKRKAFARVAARDIVFCEESHLSGRFCGRIVSLFMSYPGKRGLVEKFAIPAFIQLKLWLGPCRFSPIWNHYLDGGTMALYAEVFEYQGRSSMALAWKDTKWSDEAGKIRIETKKEVIHLPTGYQWRGEWFVDASYASMHFNEHLGYNRAEDEVYEYQTRTDLERLWNDEEKDIIWADEDFVVLEDKMKISCLPGWQWLDHWHIDRHGQVDSEGWEYSINNKFRQVSSAERNYHQWRRRRWVRHRIIPAADAGQSHRLLDKEGWEYATNVDKEFHPNEKYGDRIRRRRWHRRLTRKYDGTHVIEPIYENLALKVKELKKIENEDPEFAKFSAYLIPRIYIKYDKVIDWQLRCYILQGRNLLPSKRNGLCDAYVSVTFLSQIQCTQTIIQAVNPYWNQTLIFQHNFISAYPERIKAHPYLALVEVFDRAELGEDEFLGRFTIAPQVRTDTDNQAVPTDNAKLNWHLLSLGNKHRGEILAAFELYQRDNVGHLPQLPPKIESKKDAKPNRIYLVPTGTRPQYNTYIVEFLCWGVRNLKKFSLRSIKSPFVEIQVGQTYQKTIPLRNALEDPNFDNPILRFETEMPTDAYYMSPITICLYEKRLYGLKPLLGMCAISDMQNYIKKSYCNLETIRNVDDIGPYKIKSNEPLIVTVDPDKKGVDEPELDWWSKFYASVGDASKCKGYLEKGLKKMQIFSTSLEELKPYNNFEDFCETFYLAKVKKGKSKDPEYSEYIGQIRGRLHIYEVTSDAMKEEVLSQKVNNLPYLKPEKCFIRIYIIKASNLASKNRRGTADPYIKVKCGKHVVSGRKQFKSKTLDPLFGQVFELSAVIPLEKVLHIQVKDRNMLGSDDDIGETVIDLENRLLTMWRATCGLPHQFCIDGPCLWRDQMLPKDILLEYCQQQKFPKPIFSGNTMVSLHNVEFDLADIEKSAEQIKLNPYLGQEDQRLALHILNALSLVPEHVETRPLYCSTDPGVEQGKLQMWVDIFPFSQGPIPPAVDILPRQPTSYQLRLVVYNTRYTLMEKMSMGEYIADLYVKAWIVGLQMHRQSTDVHYRVIDGGGSFNWRMVFDFDYLAAEQTVIVREKQKFWHLSGKSEEAVKPQLIVQLWDNKKFGREGHLGQCTFDLNSFYAPNDEPDDLLPGEEEKEQEKKKKKRRCARCCIGCLKCCCSCAPMNKKKREKIYLEESADDTPKLSIFNCSQIRGWWPCVRIDETDRKELTGKVNLQMQLLTKADAVLDPVGKGRKAPNVNPYLSKPDRLAWDRFWCTSRFRAFCRYIWRKWKWHIIIGMIVSLLITTIVVFFYKLPDWIIEYEAHKKS